jgi:uncharacterized protein (TIGR00255 family)
MAAKIRSMTGFGRASLRRGGVEVNAEVRALNQRFLEIKANLPRGWGEYEAEVRRLVQATVSRGRVEVFIRCAAAGPPRTRVIVNDPLARSYVNELRRLARVLQLDGELQVEALLNRPEIFQVIEEEADGASAARLGMMALRQALRVMDRERAREGAALARDLRQRLARIARGLPTIARLSESSRKAVAANFRARVRELLDTQPLSERRLFDEAAAAAQHADITEELTRLRSHLQGLRELIDRAGPCGKPVEFLLQEIHREINTIGSKSQSAQLSRVTVELKGEIEKLREQIQNVE